MGHAADAPLHDSGGSQTPADARQVVEAGAKASLGHAVTVPLQVSATSHGPAVARHT